MSAEQKPRTSGRGAVTCKNCRFWNRALRAKWQDVTQGGGSVIANGTVTMDATGDASFSGPGASRNAAAGLGGVVQVLAGSGGTITVAQAFNATADGFGGFQSNFAGGFAGGTGAFEQDHEGGEAAAGYQ